MDLCLCWIAILYNMALRSRRKSTGFGPDQRWTRRELLLLAARARAGVAEGALRGPHALVLEHPLLRRALSTAAEP